MGQETATKVPDAPQYVTLDLPEGMTVEDFLAGEPEAAKSPSSSGAPHPESSTVAPTTEKSAAEKPAEKIDAEPKGDVRKALKEERGKTKDLKADRDVLRKVVTEHNLWDEVEAQRTKAMANISKGRPAPPEVRVDRAKPVAGPSAAAIEKADKADSFGRQAEPVLADAHRMVEEASGESYRMAQQAAELAVKAIPVYVMRVQEGEQREEHDGSDGKPAYDDALQKTGIFDALQVNADGTFRDPVVANSVYGSVNPAKRAYRLALDKLAKESAASTGAVVPGAQQEPEPVAPAKVEPSVVAQARQEGARQVAEAVVSNAGRPKGIQVLRDAGQPVQVGLNAAYWDSLKAMMRTKPEEFGRFMDKNPTVDQWFMGGRPPA